MGHGALRVQQQNTQRCCCLLPRSVPRWPRGLEGWWGSNISRPRPLSLSTDELSGVDDATPSCRPEDPERNSPARSPASSGCTPASQAALLLKPMGKTTCRYHDSTRVTFLCLQIRQLGRKERDKSGPTNQHIKLFPRPEESAQCKDKT